MYWVRYSAENSVALLAHQQVALLAVLLAALWVVLKVLHWVAWMGDLMVVLLAAWMDALTVDQ